MVAVAVAVLDEPRLCLGTSNDRTYVCSRIMLSIFVVVVGRPIFQMLQFSKKNRFFQIQFGNCAIFPNYIQCYCFRGIKCTLDTAVHGSFTLYTLSSNSVIDSFAPRASSGTIMESKLF
jgi:hypothetical protein